jgi:hypothetical protein
MVSLPAKKMRLLRPRGLLGGPDPPTAAMIDDGPLPDNRRYFTVTVWGIVPETLIVCRQI